MISRVRSKITKIISGITFKLNPRHPAVPAGGFHHPHPSSSAAAAAATATASPAAAEETNHHHQNHCPHDPRQRHLEPLLDRVASCFRRKHIIEPTKRLAAQVLHRNQSFLQLLHHKLQYLLHPHLSLSCGLGAFPSDYK